jgi:hypothetical protein
MADSATGTARAKDPNYDQPVTNPVKPSDVSSPSVSMPRNPVAPVAHPTVMIVPVVSSKITTGMMICAGCGMAGYFIYGPLGVFFGIVLGAIGRVLFLHFRSNSRQEDLKALG